MTPPVVIYGAVEGLLDDAVLQRLIQEEGGQPGPVYGKNGKAFLREKIAAYNEAARHFPWLILADLNHEADCAPPLRKVWLPHPAPFMCFRIAVREIESWLLSDSANLARFLRVGLSRIPANPETLDDPKSAMVRIAGHSRRRDIREDMVPRPNSGRQTGPAYTSRLIEFVKDRNRGWHPNLARQSSDSLNRCMGRLKEVVQTAKKEGS